MDNRPKRKNAKSAPQQAETYATAARPSIVERVGVEKLTIAQESGLSGGRTTRTSRRTPVNLAPQSSSQAPNSYRTETSSQIDLIGTQQPNLQPPNETAKQQRTRNKWTKELNREVMLCFYLAELKTLPKVRGTHDIWRSRNRFPEFVQSVDENQLSNQRRTIAKNRYLNDLILESLRDEAKRQLSIETRALTDPTTDTEAPESQQQQETNTEAQTSSATEERAQATTQVPQRSEGDPRTQPAPDERQRRRRMSTRRAPRRTVQKETRETNAREMEIWIRAKWLQLQTRSLGERKKTLKVSLTKKLAADLGSHYRAGKHYRRQSITQPQVSL